MYVRFQDWNVGRGGMGGGESTFDIEASQEIARRIRARYRRCWLNASKAVHQLGPGATYVEGWAIVNRHYPYVIEHGWCELDGKIIDPSYTPFVTGGFHQLVPPLAYFPGLQLTRVQLGSMLSSRRLPIAWSLPDEPEYEASFSDAWRFACSRGEHLPTPETTVVHCRFQEFDEFIGRPSRWASPYRLGPDGSRLQVNAKYRHWLIRQPLLLREVQDLRGKRLGCRCAPLPCHGDVIAELANAIEANTELVDREVSPSLTNAPS